jgi:hypothetical protein
MILSKMYAMEPINKENGGKDRSWPCTRRCSGSIDLIVRHAHISMEHMPLDA